MRGGDAGQGDPLTHEGLRRELAAFGKTTLQKALTELGDRMRSDVKRELVLAQAQASGAAAGHVDLLTRAGTSETATTVGGRLSLVANSGISPEKEGRSMSSGHSGEKSPSPAAHVWISRAQRPFASLHGGSASRRRRSHRHPEGGGGGGGGGGVAAANLFRNRAKTDSSLGDRGDGSFPAAAYAAAAAASGILGQNLSRGLSDDASAGGGAATPTKSDDGEASVGPRTMRLMKCGEGPVGEARSAVSTPSAGDARRAGSSPFVSPRSALTISQALRPRKPDAHVSLLEDSDGERMPLVKKISTSSEDEEADFGTSIENFVSSPYFEQSTGVIVVISALTIGFETNYRATRPPTRTMDLTMNAFEVCFSVLFTVELALRIHAKKTRFFAKQGLIWNLFDIWIVGVQWLDLLTQALDVQRVWSGRLIIESMRILRLTRITRLVRVLHLFEELRTIVSSIFSSMRSLCWTLALLTITIYMFAVFFTEVVHSARMEGRGSLTHDEVLEYWFSSLGRTLLTLYEVLVGGCTWDEVAVALLMDVSWTTSVLFCAYIAFSVFAILNVVTGVFVEKAMNTAKEESDVLLANHICDLFFDNRSGDDSQSLPKQLNMEEFCQLLEYEYMREYFKALNVDPSEAGALFQLLDADDSGLLDAEEIIAGCLRLKGNAKALDVSLLVREVGRLHRRMSTVQSDMESLLMLLVPAGAAGLPSASPSAN